MTNLQVKITIMTKIMVKCINPALQVKGFDRVWGYGVVEIRMSCKDKHVITVLL